MTDKKFVVWVDDDRLLLSLSITALKEESIDVLSIDNVKDAYKFIKNDPQKIAGIIIDVMMDPGELLADRATRHGLETGYRFADYLSEQDLLKETSLFFLTNASFTGEVYRTADGEKEIPRFKKSKYESDELVDLVIEQFGLNDNEKR